METSVPDLIFLTEQSDDDQFLETEPNYDARTGFSEGVVCVSISNSNYHTTKAGR